MTDPDDPGDLDTPLTRALRAPGTDAELAESERYLAMFRAGVHAEPAPRRRRHAVRRLGAGTALGVVLAVGGGGVAAAYAGSLPAPLQRIAHRVLGPIGAPPAPTPSTETAKPRAPRTAEPSGASGTSAPPASPAPSASRSPQPSRSPSRSPRPTTGPTALPTPTESASIDPSAGPSASASPTGSADPTPSPSESPSGSPSGSPSASPTPSGSPTAGPTGAPLRPATLVLTGDARQVGLGGSATLSGTVLTRGADPVVGAVVVLERRGPQGWARVSSARSDENGSVALPTPPATQTTTYRLRTGTGRATVRSATWRVALRPALTTTVLPGATPADPVVATVTVSGGSPGDDVRLMSRGREAGRARLGADGTVSFALPALRRDQSYVVVLAATSRHTTAKAALLVPGRA